jgi:DNA mismatch endonuclease (patch repair protein)
VNASDLPGSPDIVFDELRKAVFVNGCFWHAHSCRTSTITSLLAARGGYWREKFAGNKRRDGEALERLRSLGWDVLTVWECECDDERRLRARLAQFLREALVAIP